MPHDAASPRVGHPLSTLRNALSRIDLREDSTDALHALLGLAERLRDDRYRVRDELAAVQHDDELLAALSTRSTVHPNGFAKVVLHSDARCSVRLHVWNRRDGLWVADTQPHGHRWVFASWILVGALREVVFRLGPGARYDRYAYTRVGLEGRLAADGAATLRTALTLDRNTNDVYGRSQATLHTASPIGDDLVASLVLQGPHHPDPTPVYVLDGHSPLSDESAVDADQLRSLLIAVTEGIR